KKEHSLEYASLLRLAYCLFGNFFNFLVQHQLQDFRFVLQVLILDDEGYSTYADAHSSYKYHPATKGFRVPLRLPLDLPRCVSFQDVSGVTIRRVISARLV